MTRETLADLITELGRQFSGLKNHELFVLWILLALATEDPESAKRALTPPRKEKSADAVFIDDERKCVFVVQGKYHGEGSATNEPRPDVMDFARIAETVEARSGDYATFEASLGDVAKQKFGEARERVRRRGYLLNLVYATTGRVSSDLKTEATKVVRRNSERGQLQVIDGARVKARFEDYVSGVSPGIGSLTLSYASRAGAERSEPLLRVDRATGIKAWVLSLSGSEVQQMYARAGRRLFARNIRGYLGDKTDVNSQIKLTISKSPGFFWYYNNGITLVCDDAVDTRDAQTLQVFNPQVINGQQTIRTLSAAGRLTNRLSVSTRIIQIPRNRYSGKDFDDLVNKIVVATNWQNEIDPIDIHANDSIQIRLQRDLSDLDYQYIRKKVSRAEATLLGLRGWAQVKMTDFAYAVAVCEFSSELPVSPQYGKSELFSERWYHRIFPTGNPDFYLSRYWMVSLVRSIARRNNHYSDFKWMVSHFAWSMLKGFTTSRVQRDVFVDVASKKGGPGDSDVAKASRTLVAALSHVYSAAYAYYSQNKRTPKGKVLSTAAFVKQAGHDDGFETFWNSSANIRGRQSFERGLGRFGQQFDRAVQHEDRAP